MGEGALSAPLSGIRSASQDVDQFLELLRTGDIAEAFGIENGSDTTAIDQRIQELRRIARHFAETLAEDDPRRAEVLQRAEDAERRLRDPLEVHIMLRAGFMRLDATDPDVRGELELDYLRTHVPKRVRGGEAAQAKELAERYYALMPQDPLAIGTVAIARYRTSQSHHERQSAVDLLIAASTTEVRADAIEVHLALAELALDSSRESLARRALEAAEAINDKEPRLIRLRQLLRELRGGPASIRAEGPQSQRAPMSMRAPTPSRVPAGPGSIVPQADPEKTGWVESFLRPNLPFVLAGVVLLGAAAFWLMSSQRDPASQPGAWADFESVLDCELITPQGTTSICAISKAKFESYTPRERATRLRETFDSESAKGRTRLVVKDSANGKVLQEYP